MVLVREAGPGEWQLVRDARLAALRDTPSAFASTYQREAAFTEADWRGRLSSSSATFLAYLPEVSPAGLSGALEHSPGTAELVSMWVSPAARGRGVGEALVAAVTDWAKTRDHTAVHLWVTRENFPARALYERCGFSPTGERQPLPSDSGLDEIGMRLPL
jgi:GNAT superfamily N-acetyltransferase